MNISDIVKLNVPSEFGCHSDYDEFTIPMQIVGDQLDNTVEILYGASKFIIISNEWDKIVKIPFNGMFYCNDKNEDVDIFNYFKIKDYCAREASIYADAVAFGVSEFFAETKFGGVTEESKTPFYISERVYEFDDVSKSDKIKPSKETINKIKEYKFYDISSKWLACAYEYYGGDAVKKLIDFIEEEEISDLHNGNIGFRADGAPVIFDYSSYLE